MALFTLRTGYRVETTPTGGRVVHVRTGDALELNFAEVQLLARAAAGGLAGEDPAFRPVIRKLTSLGLLEKVARGEDMKVPPPPGAKYTSGLWILPGKDAPPAEGEPRRVSVDPDPPVLELISSEMPVTMLSESLAPNEPEPEPAKPSKGSDAEVSFEMLPPSPEDEPVAEADQVTFPAPDVREPVAEPAPAGPPPPPNPDEPVPTFRADLKLTSHAGGLYDVTDTARNKTFSFYDFELSIARMLNGRRSYKDVIGAASRLGIPVNLESLGQFVRQIERYGFVAPKGTRLEVPPEDSIWGKREKWDEGVRTLFQSGLRLTRQARYREAAPYFEAILQNDPENPEAGEMLEQIRLNLSKAGQAAGELAAVEEPPPPAPEAAPPTPAPPPAPAAAPPAPPPAPPAAFLTPTPPAPPPATPAPIPVEAPAADSSPRPPPPAPATPPRPSPTLSAARPEPAGAAPLKPSSRTGLWVAAGLAIAGTSLAAGWYFGSRQSANAPVQSPPDAVAKAGPDASAAPAPGLDAAAVEVVALDAALQPADAAQGGVGAAPASVDAGAAAVPHVDEGRWLTLDIVRKGRVTMGEIHAVGEGTVAWAAAMQERITRGQVVGVLHAGDNDEPLTAPKAGLLMPKLAEGGSAKPNDLLATVVYHEAYIQATFAGPGQPDPTWSCEVSDDATSEKAPCKVVEAKPRGTGFMVTATTEPTWFDAAPKAKLRVAPP